VLCEATCPPHSVPPQLLAGRVVFLHPVHNFAFVAFDPGASHPQRWRQFALLLCCQVLRGRGGVSALQLNLGTQPLVVWGGRK